jgi:hypothetical protein
MCFLVTLHLPRTQLRPKSRYTRTCIFVNPMTYFDGCVTPAVSGDFWFSAVKCNWNKVDILRVQYNRCTFHRCPVTAGRLYGRYAQWNFQISPPPPSFINISRTRTPTNSCEDSRTTGWNRLRGHLETQAQDKGLVTVPYRFWWRLLLSCVYYYNGPINVSSSTGLKPSRIA